MTMQIQNTIYIYIYIYTYELSRNSFTLSSPSSSKWHITFLTKGERNRRSYLVSKDSHFSNCFFDLFNSENAKEVSHL